MADDKKDEFTEKVGLRVWDEKQKTFRKQLDDLDAYRRVIDGKDVIVVGGRLAGTSTGTPAVKSEIIDKDGIIYTVDKVSGKRPYLCYVTKKAPEKKPD